MSKTYKCRPSELVEIQDTYLALCFDEACSFILNQVQENKREPNFKKFEEKTDIPPAKIHFGLASDYFASLELANAPMPGRKEMN